MSYAKYGQVILPFLSENQLEGFCRQEVKNVDIDLFKKVWSEKQSFLQTRQPTDLTCGLKEMLESDKERYFYSDASFQEYYQNQEITPIWLTHFKQITPLKPFIAVENCEELSKRYEQEGFESICLKKSDKRYKAQFNLNHQDNLQLSMITEDRSIHVKGINIKKGETSADIKFEVHVGRPSHFIEILFQDDKYYLLNGLHRLYTLMKHRYDGLVPCLLMNPAQEQKIVHPYQQSIFGKYPPILEDFLDENLLYSFELQTGMKHIQLLTQDHLIPNWI